MAAMAFAAIKLHREREVVDALTREQARILAEGGRQPRGKYAENMNFSMLAAHLEPRKILRKLTSHLSKNHFQPISHKGLTM